jgi:uncharacterized protein YndB with AHSA1/START domain
MTSDVIEREIVIHADIDHVWALVSRAGFWIGDDLHFDTEAAEGELVVIETEKYGRFPVRVDRLDAPRYAAYRWASAFPGANPTEGNSTLVEFTLVQQDGGVLLRLRESGFAALAGAETIRDSALADNTEGWSLQLERLQRVADRTPTR